MKHYRFDILLWAWSGVAVCAALSHIVLPEWTAVGTTWASSPHWQREIAYFDLLLAFIFSWAARQQDVALKRKVTLLLCCLSLVLGENHLEGWLAEPRLFHVVFTMGNALALAWGAVACWSVRKNGPEQLKLAEPQP